MRTLIASSIALSLSGVPSQSAGGPACGSTSALDSREGSRSYLMRSRSGFWRVPQHYPGDGLGPSPGTGAGDIYPPGVFSCLGQQTTRIKGYRPPPFGCLISCTSSRISWSGVRLVRASPGDAVLSGPMNRASSVVGR
jgi:hypothetical protein